MSMRRAMLMGVAMVLFFVVFRGCRCCSAGAHVDADVHDDAVVDGDGVDDYVVVAGEVVGVDRGFACATSVEDGVADEDYVVNVEHGRGV